MMPYQAHYRSMLESAHGRATLDAVRASIATAPEPFTASQVIDDVCGLLGVVDSWDVLNALDHLVTAAVIIELTAGQDVWGQDRRYRRCNMKSGSMASFQSAAPIEARTGGEPDDMPNRRPVIVCLCGSTRFKEAFQEANYSETMAGRIVLSVGCYMHSDRVPITDEQKKRLDELHLRKIDLADEVLILNVGGYIGDSTRRELNYAAANGKWIRFLEPANW